MDKQNIILVGVLDKKGSTNVHQANALLNLGFNVIPVNYRTIISEQGHDFYMKYLLSLVQNAKPSLVIFSKCNDTNPLVMEEVSRRCLTWWWMMDSIKVAEGMKAQDYVKRCHFASATDPNVVEYIKQVNPRSVQIIEGINPRVFKPVEPVEEYRCDISFIGTQTPERDMYFKLLKEAGYNVKFFGPQYSGQEVVDSDFAAVCSSSTFALSVNTFNGISNYFSDRLIRLLACGTCPLHLDETETICNYFKAQEEVVIFKNPEDLLDKLPKITLEQAMKIALKGRDKVLNQYLWEHSMIRMINFIKEHQNG